MTQMKEMSNKVDKVHEELHHDHNKFENETK